jgi:hypothetical protein
MSRLERYRRIRIMRRKFTFVCMLSFFITLSGILVVDKSINEIMNREKGLNIVSIKPYKDDYYYIKVFNKNFLVNTKPVKNDIDRFKDWLSDKF